MTHYIDGTITMTGIAFFLLRGLAVSWGRFRRD